MRATRAIIHLDHLRHNLQLIRQLVGPDCQICFSIKADAYGHGAIPAAKIALEEGISSFGVATLGEAIELRQAGIKQPILLFSLFLPEEISQIITYQISPFVASREMVSLLNQEAQKLSQSIQLHLKVDTGMGRIGCQPGEAIDIIREIADSPLLNLAGICTHFPISDQDDLKFTLNQIKTLEQLVSRIKALDINPGLIHTANSGAIIGCPKSYHNLVRPGIMTYGYYPSLNQKRYLDLKPVMTFKTKVIFIKTVKKGTPISYGLNYVTQKDTRIATLPVGYADGYNRLLSNQGKVLINGKQYTISGNVCMDQCMVDIGPDSGIKLYDDVILFGAEKGSLTAEDIGRMINTIPYEVTSLISKRVPRIYTDSQ